MFVQSGLSDDWWREAMQCVMAFLKDEYRMRIDFTHNSTVQSFLLVQKFFTHPSLATTRVVFTSSTKKMLPGFFMVYALHTEGGWIGDLLSADWDELEKNIASGVHVKRFNHRQVQIDTCIKQEGHVVLRPHHIRFLSKTIRKREQTPTLKDTLFFGVMREETRQKKMYFLRHFKLPNVKLQRRRTISGSVQFQAVSFTVITLHLASSNTCPVITRSRFF